MPLIISSLHYLKSGVCAMRKGFTVHYHEFSNEKGHTDSYSSAYNLGNRPIRRNKESMGTKLSPDILNSSLASKVQELEPLMIYFFYFIKAFIYFGEVRGGTWQLEVHTSPP